MRTHRPWLERPGRDFRRTPAFPSIVAFLKVCNKPLSGDRRDRRALSHEYDSPPLSSEYQISQLQKRSSFLTNYDREAWQVPNQAWRTAIVSDQVHSPCFPQELHTDTRSLARNVNCLTRLHDDAYGLLFSLFYNKVCKAYFLLSVFKFVCTYILTSTILAFFAIFEISERISIYM